MRDKTEKEEIDTEQLNTIFIYHFVYPLNKRKTRSPKDNWHVFLKV